MEKKLRLKIGKLFLLCLFVLTSVVSFNYATAKQVQAATTLDIIQNYQDGTIPLRASIYVGERMDWDVIRNGVLETGVGANGFTWTSSNPAVAKTDSPDGGVAGVSKGTAIITVEYQDGTKATATIIIKQPADSITLTGSDTVYVGQTTKLNATINPSTTNDKADGVVWKSSNTTIATVDANTGVITAKGNGMVNITATFTNKDCLINDGSSYSPVPPTVSETSTITVLTKVSGISLDKKYIILKSGSTYQFTATIAPSTASNKTVNWTSSNIGVFDINNGKVSNTKEGYGYVTATTSNVNVEAYASVSVYTPLNAVGAYTNKATDLKNESIINSNAGSVLQSIPKNAQVTIYGKSGEFYYVKYGNTYGFVLKADLTIPVTNIALDKKVVTIKKGNSQIFKATITPALASNKKVNWVSTNTNFFKVSNGTVTGTKDGFGYVQAIAVGGNKSVYSAISVYESLNAMEAYANKKTTIRNGSHSTSTMLSVLKNLAIKEKVTIYGKSGSFYYVKYGNTYGFVLKSDLTIPVKKIVLNKSEVILKRSNYQNLKATLTPNLATNKTVSWKSSDTKIFSAKDGKITSIKEGYGYVTATAIEGNVSAYVPVSVYEPVTNFVAYTKKVTNFKNGSSEKHFLVKTKKKLAQSTKVTVCGKSGKFYYVKYGNEYGFVLKTDLTYMEISPSRVTVNKDIKKYPIVTVRVYNNTTNPKWTNTNNVVAFKYVKKSKVTKKYKDGTSWTTSKFYVIPKKEGRANAKVIVGKQFAYYYVSSYTRLDNIEGYIKATASNMYIGANENLAVRKTLKKDNKVIILAKCTNNWYYVKSGDYKGFVKAKDVVYIKSSNDTTMYRYNNKNIYSYLANSTADSKIIWSTEDYKTGKVDSQKLINNRKQAQIWAEKPGEVTFVATYTYAKGKTINARTKIKIEDVQIEIYSVTGKSVGNTLQVKAGIKNVTNPTPVIKFSSNCSAFKKVSEKNNVGKFIVQEINNCKITANYRGITKSKSVQTDPLLIFGSQNRERLESDGSFSEDMTYSNQKSETIIAKVPNITKSGDYSYTYGRSEEEYHRKRWNNLCFWFTENDLQPVGYDMINHFMEGSGSDYRHTDLTTAVMNHKNTQTFQNGFRESFLKVLRQQNGNVSKFKYEHTEGTIERRKKYPLIDEMSERQMSSISFTDPIVGLTFTINKVHGMRVEIVSYKYDSNTKKYSVKLKYSMFDHFGLDADDLREYGSFSPGFRSWYILQHDSKFSGKYKPFITRIEFYHTFSGTL